MPGAETFQASANAYDRFVGRYGPQLAEALIGFAGVAAPGRALDVGCGLGDGPFELSARAWVASGVVS
jgi:ubiquinone/menaquinone biosynthesis C-methylase UbiE